MSSDRWNGKQEFVKLVGNGLEVMQIVLNAEKMGWIVMVGNILEIEIAYVKISIQQLQLLYIFYIRFFSAPTL